jgi:predicted ester cyclase
MPEDAAPSAPAPAADLLASELIFEQPSIEAYLAQAGSGRRQPLAGFDEDYTDIVDYIVRCTHKIWEEKAVGLIYTHYAHNTIVHTAGGTIYGREAVVRNTLQSLAMTADIRDYTDDVIWSGDEHSGFYTSHRVLDSSTHTGYSEFGPPTGRRFERWVIADCRVIGNRIVEEWLTYDTTASLTQMGYDPLELARRSASPPSAHTFGEVHRQPGGQQAPALMDVVPGGDPQRFIRALLTNLWNARLINMVRLHFTPGHVAFVPGGRKLYGHAEYENFVITLLACFPDLALTIDHQNHLGNAERGYRVATRFTLQGTHEGYGPYGAPTGRRIFLIGISHHELRDGKVAQEWTLFDEFALLKQLYGQVSAAQM